MIDKGRIEKAIKEIIGAINENPSRQGLMDTPARIADMYEELFEGIAQDPATELAMGFEEGHREMVILKDIPFYSLCEHHFLPFYGFAHIGYIPNIEGKVVGTSKLGRVVEILARRPQLQERLTTQIADTITKAINPDGVAVVLKAEHLCMTMRGIKKPGSNVITSATRGVFRSRQATRAEFLALIEGR